MSDFDEMLAMGRAVEHATSQFLRKSKDCYVIPTYDYTGSNGDRAPKARGQTRNLVIPDLQVLRQGNTLWVEVKAKTTSPYNRKRHCNVHGIDYKHYVDYLEVQRVSGCRVILFVHELDTDERMAAWLDSLDVIYCQCRSCGGEAARQRHDHLIYFRRDHFKPVDA